MMYTASAGPDRRQKKSIWDSGLTIEEVEQRFSSATCREVQAWLERCEIPHDFEDIRQIEHLDPTPDTLPVFSSEVRTIHQRIRTGYGFAVIQPVTGLSFDEWVPAPSFSPDDPAHFLVVPSHTEWSAQAVADRIRPFLQQAIV